MKKTARDKIFILIAACIFVFGIYTSFKEVAPLLREYRGEALIWYLILIFGSLAFCYVWQLLFLPRTRSYLKILEQQALKHNGRVEKYLHLTEPSLIFSRYYFEFNLRPESWHGDPERDIPLLDKIGTKISCYFNLKIHYAIQIDSQTFTFRNGPLFSKPIKLNDAIFDDNFIIRTEIINKEDISPSCQGIVQDVLTPELRARLQRLKNFGRWVYVYLNIQGKSFELFVEKWLLDGEEMDFFIDTALKFVDRLKEMGVANPKMK